MLAIVGRKSSPDMMVPWLTAPRGKAAGYRTMKGTRTPPSYRSCLAPLRPPLTPTIRSGWLWLPGRGGAAP